MPLTYVSFEINLVWWGIYHACELEGAATGESFVVGYRHSGPVGCGWGSGWATQTTWDSSIIEKGAYCKTIFYACTSVVPYLIYVIAMYCKVSPRLH
jgi:hypothetical protein